MIYQIYPRSFQDSDGDGIGDLAGIIRRLPHIAGLGADAIWISPFFKSPMKDFGYDVTDYCDVDPMFGTLDDFDALIDEAHRLGLRVMIDSVISHTSDDHPWFKESRTSRDNAKADWYVWADPKPDGTPPNNWLSIFGGSAWQWDTRRRQYYLHNFLAEQPDLNFHNRAVQDALLETIRFWLERGVDGFRLDTINFYFHSAGLEDNPALPESERNASIAPAVNPYNFQDHIYDKSRPENVDFLRRFRALLDEYPAVAAVGEVGDAQRGLEVVAQYTAGNDRVQMCYSFDFLGPEKLSAGKVRSILETFGKVASDGWSCWALSNHDVVRHATRWAKDEPDSQAYLKVISALLMSLRGSVCLYQGEELGLDEAELASKTCRTPTASASGPNSRAATAAARRWCGKQPSRMPAFPRASRGCRCRLAMRGKRSTRSKAIPPRCSNTTAASWRFAGRFRPSPKATSSSWRPRATRSPSRASRATNGSSAPSISGTRKRRSISARMPGSSPIEGHGFEAGVRDGKIRLGPYQAWFGRKA